MSVIKKRAPRKAAQADAPKRPFRKLAEKARQPNQNSDGVFMPRYPLQAPALLPGVVPAGKQSGIAQDSLAQRVFANDLDIMQVFSLQNYQGFPGYAYLSQLATRTEYRALASTIANEITRKWIEFSSGGDEDTGQAEKIKMIEGEFKRLDLRQTFARAAADDCYFGRTQFYIDIEGQDKDTPLILSDKTIKVGTLSGIKKVEPIWTTPNTYNSNDPAAKDFYRPTSWFMLGNEVHASRLLTVVTREMPDILKPAFNFSGISLSQLVEPYVNNWLRTRQSVSDLINNFSITAVATDMGQVLSGVIDAEGSLNDRADYFTATRSNKGLMLLDKDREELVQLNVPLSGLSDLQAQAQEHMCSASRIPAIILTGISPAGLNASSEGEIRVFYDWISSQQEAYWSKPLEIILKVVQLHLFGAIDDSITFKWVPLYQTSETEQADIKTKGMQADVGYIDAGVLSPEEVRQKLAADPNSGYNGIDVDDLPEMPEEEPFGFGGLVDPNEEA